MCMRQAPADHSTECSHACTRARRLPEGVRAGQAAAVGGRLPSSRPRPAQVCARAQQLVQLLDLHSQEHHATRSARSLSLRRSVELCRSGSGPVERHRRQVRRVALRLGQQHSALEGAAGAVHASTQRGMRRGRRAVRGTLRTTRCARQHTAHSAPCFVHSAQCAHTAHWPQHTAHARLVLFTAHSTRTQPTGHSTLRAARALSTAH
jgi:hypothetical protein